MRTRKVLGGRRESHVFHTSLNVVELDHDSRLSRLEGRCAPYGVWTNRGWFLESFAASCFDKSISESARSLPLLIEHDPDRLPVGRVLSWESRDDGLYGVWELADTAEAQHVGKLAQDGFLTGMSVGYMPNLSEWETNEDWRYPVLSVDDLDRCTRIEARLFEASLVSNPAMIGAEISHVSSRSPTRPGTPKLDAWRSWRSTMTP